MKPFGDFLINQSTKVLENKQHAVIAAAVLSVLPFASWLSVALVAFICLRKGAKTGLEIMVPAMVIHSVPLMMMVTVDAAIINTLIAFVPCYFSALVLRKTASWQWVGGVIFLQALIGSLLMQGLAPELIGAQFRQFSQALSQFQEYQQLLAVSGNNLTSSLLAQLFFSMQLSSIVVSALISLIFARSIQAKLFVPGGLKRELFVFRCGKVALSILMVVALGSYYQISVAINVLPLVLGYFLVSGFSLSYFVLARKRRFRVAALLMLLVLIKPLFVLAAYIGLGSLDSLFNFRHLLPSWVKESV